VRFTVTAKMVVDTHNVENAENMVKALFFNAVLDGEIIKIEAGDKL
jgi:hypothetical protein